MAQEVRSYSLTLVGAGERRRWDVVCYFHCFSLLLEFDDLLVTIWVSNR